METKRFRFFISAYIYSDCCINHVLEILTVIKSAGGIYKDKKASNLKVKCREVIMAEVKRQHTLKGITCVPL